MSKITQVPDTLLYYYALLNRKKKVTASESRQFERSFKGYLGEKSLASLLSQFESSKILPLYNLLYEINGSEFQIDTALVTYNRVYLLEVKNFFGDYIIENNKIYSLNKRTQIYNPVHQLERTEYMFKKLLAKLDITTNVTSYVVFINPHFVLYGAQVQSPFLFASQVDIFLKKIARQSRPLSQKEYILVEKLTQENIQVSMYDRLPEVQPSEIKNNIACVYCFNNIKKDNSFYFFCPSCKKYFDNEEVILQTIYLRYTLFPQEEITVGNISEWCNGELSKHTIRRVLAKYFHVHRKGRYTLYSFKNENQHKNFLSSYIIEKAEEERKRLNLPLVSP